MVSAKVSASSFERRVDLHESSVHLVSEHVPRGTHERCVLFVAEVCFLSVHHVRDWIITDWSADTHEKCPFHILPQQITPSRGVLVPRTAGPRSIWFARCVSPDADAEFQQPSSCPRLYIRIQDICSAAISSNANGRSTKFKYAIGFKWALLPP